MPEETSLSYQSIYKDSERKDLLPPNKIEIEYTNEGGNIPFEVHLDQEEVGNFMRLEGVTGGKALKIIFRENQGILSKGKEVVQQAIQNPVSLYNFQGLKNMWQDLKNGIRIGNCRIKSQEIITTVNLGSIYDTAIISLPRSQEQIEEKFRHTIAEVLAHEIGHARQPQGMRGGNIDSYIKIIGASWALIDAGRRTLLPWLGPAEPFALLAEGAAAEAAVKKIYYNQIPGEKFVREYSSSATKSWAEMLKISSKE